MWLPPLRPVLPEGAPVGIELGVLKPQREVERRFWPGPPTEGLECRETVPITGWPPPGRRRKGILPALGAACTGALLLLAAVAGMALGPHGERRAEPGPPPATLAYATPEVVPASTPARTQASPSADGASYPSDAGELPPGR